MDLNEKFALLKADLKAMGSIAVAFSGGVDSSFLLKVAHDVLGEKALGVTARSSTYPEREFNEAVAFAKQYGIPHKVITSEELEVDGFSDNPLNRCYLCKSELFVKINALAKELGYNFVAEGSNQDDLGDYRPGLQAVSELQVVSPLRKAGLTKQDIRILSKEMGLKTWDKPSFACLSSRFPYGEKITVEKLNQIDKAEQYLMDLGFRQVRVRHHGDIARIEIDQNSWDLFDEEKRKMVTSKLKEFGFRYVCLDMQGYRTGSMNEGIVK